MENVWDRKNNELLCTNGFESPKSVNQRSIFVFYGRQFYQDYTVSSFGSLEVLIDRAIDSSFTFFELTNFFVHEPYFDKLPSFQGFNEIRFPLFLVTQFF